MEMVTFNLPGALLNTKGFAGDTPAQAFRNRGRNRQVGLWLSTTLIPPP
jgi:hypothetical protein